MSYNKKVWKSGDRITKEALNNMENGIEAAHQNSGGSGTSYDDTEIKTDINTIKTDLGTAQLTTTAKDVKGAVNEVAAQYKDIAYKTIVEDNKLYLVKADGTKIDAGTELPIVDSTVIEEKTVKGTQLILNDCVAESPKSFVLTGKTLTKDSYSKADTLELSINDDKISLPNIYGLLNSNNNTVYSDSLDIIKKQITRRIRKITFTGDEDFTYDNYVCNVYTISDTKYYHNSSSNYDNKCGAISSHFTIQNYSSITPTGAYKNLFFGLNGDGAKINFSYIVNDTQATTEQFKTFLKEQYNAGTPVEVIYILKNEYVENITIANDISLSEGKNTISANGNIIDLIYNIKSSQDFLSDFIKKTGIADANSEWWNNFRHLMGFNKNTTPIPQEIDTEIRARMITAKGGGRWASGSTITSTEGEESESVFVDGGHVFEGWDESGIWRLTMLIGKFTKGRAHIFTFKPNTNGVEEFGIVTIGGDHEYDGMDVSTKYAQMWGNFISGSFSGKDNYGSQKYYGGLASSNKTVPGGANLEITAIANSSVPSQARFNDCLNGLKIPVLATDITNLDNGVIWYNSTEHKYKGIVNGEIKSFVVE